MNLGKYAHLDLENEKLEKIINSGLKEFSTQTFKKASTNSIVKDAGISRGLLYHYFKDKEDLYEFLTFFSFEVMIRALEDNSKWEEPDLLIRFVNVSEQKYKVMQKYPYIMDFYVQAMTTEETDKIKLNYRERIESFESNFYKKGVDYSLFREDLDQEECLSIIQWTIRGLGDNVIKKSMEANGDYDMEVFIDKVKGYMDTFRKMMYK